MRIRSFPGDAGNSSNVAARVAWLSSGFAVESAAASFRGVEAPLREHSLKFVHGSPTIAAAFLRSAAALFILSPLFETFVWKQSVQSCTLQTTSRFCDCERDSGEVRPG